MQLDHGVLSFLCIAGFRLVNFCWGFLFLFSSKILTYKVPFLSCLVSVSGWWWHHRRNLRGLYLLQFFWNSLRRMDIGSFLFPPCLVECPSEAVCSWTFVCSVSFKIITAVSISLPVNSLLKLSVSSWLRLGRLQFSVNRNLSISSSCSICLHITFHTILLQSFAFLWYWLLFLLSFLIFFIWDLSCFFLVSLARGLMISSFQKTSSWFVVLLTFSFKKKNLNFIYLFYFTILHWFLPYINMNLPWVYMCSFSVVVFFFNLNFISSLIFIISFLLLTLGFVNSFFFLILLGGRLACLSEIFLASWGSAVSLWTSFLELLFLYSIGFVKLCFHFHLSQGIF